MQFIARTEAVVRLGAMMLAAGASAARVRASMARAASALGIERMDCRVGMTDVIVTTGNRGLFRTRVIEIRSPGVNADHLTSLKRLTNALTPGITAHELETRMDVVEHAPPRYSVWMRVAAAAMACAAFAFLNNGGWGECLAVAVAVSVGQYVRILLSRIRVNEFLTAFIAACASLLVYLGAAGALQLLGAPLGAHDAAMTSAVLFLVPGFPLVTGALDLARLDLNSGIARVVYSLLLLVAVGSAVWTVVAIFHTSIIHPPAAELTEPLLSLVRVVAGFLGVLGFAILFSTPIPIAVAAGVLGGLANMGRLLMVDAGAMTAVAAVAAAVAVGLGAFLLGERLHAARVTVTVPAVLIMVPGAAAYRSIVSVIDGDTLLALQSGMQAVFVVMALAVGLTVGRILTEREWLRGAR